MKTKRNKEKQRKWERMMKQTDKGRLAIHMQRRITVGYVCNNIGGGKSQIQVPRAPYSTT